MKKLSAIISIALAILMLLGTFVIATAEPLADDFHLDMTQYWDPWGSQMTITYVDGFVKFQTIGGAECQNAWYGIGDDLSTKQTVVIKAKTGTFDDIGFIYKDTADHDSSWDEVQVEVGEYTYFITSKPFPASGLVGVGLAIDPKGVGSAGIAEVYDVYFTAKPMEEVEADLNNSSAPTTTVDGTTTTTVPVPTTTTAPVPTTTTTTTTEPDPDDGPSAAYIAAQDAFDAYMEFEGDFDEESYEQEKALYNDFKAKYNALTADEKEEFCDENMFSEEEFELMDMIYSLTLDEVEVLMAEFEEFMGKIASLDMPFDEDTLELRLTDLTASEKQALKDFLAAYDELSDNAKALLSVMGLDFEQLFGVTIAEIRAAVADNTVATTTVAGNGGNVATTTSNNGSNTGNPKTGTAAPVAIMLMAAASAVVLVKSRKK